MALSRYCLDASAYSQFMRGDARVAEILDTAEWIGLPSVVIGQLWIGFLAGGRLERNVAELAEFLGSPVVEEIPIDPDVAQVYAEIFVALRQAGHPLPSNDIWVAAAASRSGVTVLTYDEHFRETQRVGSLVLPREENYERG